MTQRLYNHDDCAPKPPEELRALCGLCDIEYVYVPGRPGHAWKLWRNDDTGYGIVIQSTQYEDWVRAIENLVRGL